jgi:S1-C subfamily serine protease
MSLDEVVTVRSVDRQRELGWTQVGGGRTILMTVAVMALVLAGCNTTLASRATSQPSHNARTQPSPTPNTTNASTTTTTTSAGSSADSRSVSAPLDMSQTAGEVGHGLVDINTTVSYQDKQAAGTRIVLTSSGEVLTNNHVIEGATSVSVTDMGNGLTYYATVVGYDRSDEVAVLQLASASGLDTINVGDSSQVTAGESVVTIGNANGVGGTPTSSVGSVTAVGQSISASNLTSNLTEQLSGLIETNASISPGDSGGALVDDTGHVVGMITAESTSPSGQSASQVGYVIPIDQAIAIAQQIEAGQSSDTVHIGPTAFLGVGLIPSAGPTGVQIAAVIPGGSAANAGLAQGDTITSVDGQPVNSFDSLIAVLLSETPGSSVQVQCVDPSGEQSSVTVELAGGPPQ